MSSHIRKYISIACVALISLCLPAGAFGADDSSHARPRPEFTAEIKTLLASPDSLLAEAPRLDRAKQERIERNRRNYKAATDPDRRYWTASELYDEYCSYDSDSAMFYAERALDYARLMGRNDFIYDMELNRCYLFSATGMLAEADNCLSAVPPDSVPLRMATKYFERLLFLYNHRDQYTGVARDKDASARTLDSLVTEMRSNLRPNSTDYGLMLGWSCLNLGADIPSSIPQLKRIVDSSPLTSRNDAVNASMLAKLYDRTGDDTNHLKYLIISAMADIRACNKEIMSLEEVAGILNDHGDLDRANSYINYCIAAANNYKSRVRLDQLSKTQGEILDSIHSRSERQESANRRYLAILIAILCVLVLATIYIMRQNRLLRRSRSTLNDANAELNNRVTNSSRSARNSTSPTRGSRHNMRTRARTSTTSARTPTPRRPTSPRHSPSAATTSTVRTNSARSSRSSSTTIRRPRRCASCSRPNMPTETCATSTRASTPSSSDSTPTSLRISTPCFAPRSASN